MLELREIPAFQQGDLKLGTCPLTITSAGTARTLEEAWALLPEDGEGLLVCADSVRRFDPSDRTGLLLNADVVKGPETVVLRSSGSTWRAWKWSEQGQEDHRYVEFRFSSTEPGRRPSNLLYRQYWKLEDDDGVAVWQPVGTRFCGFEEEER